MSACHTPFPRRAADAQPAPADVRKEGPAYDLPIALAILSRRWGGWTRRRWRAWRRSASCRFRRVMGVRGALSMAIAAKESGLRAIMLPASNAAEAACIEGLDVPAGRASERGDRPPARQAEDRAAARQTLCRAAGRKENPVRFRGCARQKGAKRALEIAAAGGHNVLMIGPPGSGKTMMARCLPGILPDMTLEEALEVTRIHSAAGTLAADAGLMAERPFRAPYPHGQRGGAGRRRHQRRAPAKSACAQWRAVPRRAAGVRPRGALEALRQPLEDGFVSVVRVSAGEIPCAGDVRRGDEPVPLRQLWQLDTAPAAAPRRKSRAIWGASPAAAGQNRYAAGGHCRPRAPDHRARRKSLPTFDSRAYGGRAQAAAGRYAGEGVSSNAELSARQLEVCPLDDACRELIGKACDKYNSPCARSAACARSRGQLPTSRGRNIGKAHILEALRYRNLEGNYWK